MDEHIKAKVQEFVEIAKQCPDNLQEKCFELLLGNYLGTLGGPKQPSDARETPPAEPEQDDEDDLGRQEDLAEGDLDMRARRFLKKYSLTLEQLNEIFYKQDEEVLPLYDDLGTTQTAECQIRVGLLQALRRGIKTGEFEFDGEQVRNECQDRKCYDAGHFTEYFKRNADLFDGFDKYDKGSPVVRLSDEGRRKVAELVKELQ